MCDAVILSNFVTFIAKFICLFISSNNAIPIIFVLTGATYSIPVKGDKIFILSSTKTLLKKKKGRMIDIDKSSKISLIFIIFPW